MLCLRGVRALWGVVVQGLVLTAVVEDANATNATLGILWHLKREDNVVAECELGDARYLGVVELDRHLVGIDCPIAANHIDCHVETTADGADRRVRCAAEGGDATVHVAVVRNVGHALQRPPRVDIEQEVFLSWHGQAATNRDGGNSLRLEAAAAIFT